MWAIANEENYLCHYGVKGMKWKSSRAGMQSNYAKAVASKYGPYGPADKLNRPTHGSLAGVPSNMSTRSNIAFNRTANSRYAGKNEDGDTIYRTTALQVKSKQASPVRKLTRTLPSSSVGMPTSDAAVIQKKLRSNSRYKASRAGMPSYVRR